MLSFLIELLLLLVRVNIEFVKAFFGLILPTREKNVSGKTVLITGAGQGIGKEMALIFHQKGANLALVDINKETVDELATELQQHKSNKVIGYRCDVTSEEEINQLATTVLQDFGQVDILINNAGIVKCKALVKLTSQDIKRTFSVNTFAHFWTIKAFLPSMIKRRTGQIVAIASIAGLTGTAHLVDYCSSKFAITGMMEALGYELETLGHDFIKLTTICPLAISTGMFKSPKTRFASVFPILTPTYTASSAVSAILSETNIATIPRSAYYSLFLLGKALPHAAVNQIRKFFVYGVEEH